MQAVTTIGRHRQVGISGARRRRGRQRADPPSAKRRYFLAFFEKLPPCLVGIEACATSHHWSRQLKALGHTVRLSGADGQNFPAPRLASEHRG